ncbi:sodium:solute symporter family transporter [Aporhodopirellula aestuarii]|uniref:Transporter n=1 Tax=Aporhodopirellula aestuarii TaxID=2950107 RepID=A0ABT0TZE4_9BACT|nr:transporter [Aporhodopirellula aestuarii]MCM2369608.1 transporter [Aporhodopirellula aestuarii]
MLTVYDYAVIAFFFAFMLALGPIFKHFSKDDSDFFRGGGQMLWWMVGGSAFMTQFSAWTFTGAASKAYEDGTLVALIFFANAVGFFLNYAWFAPRFRRMRLVSPIEAVRERFGPVNEQVFTWLQIPMSLVYAAIWLNGLAVFASAVFGFDMQQTIWGVGLVVIVLSVAGGSWAIVAGDFVQLLILMAVSIVTAVMVLGHADIGGLSGLIEKVPSHHFNWTEVARPQIIWFWVIATFVKQFLILNNMQDSYRYLGVKNEHQSRKAALLASGLMVVGPLIWFIPPMAARVLSPDLAVEFPTLKNPAEASYIFAAMNVLPIGMMGLLVCGLFAATISSMDSGLNRNAGIFVRCFYHRVKPESSSKHLLVVGQVMSGLFGVMIIVIAIYISKLEDLDLFNAMLLFSGLIAIPYVIPLVWGLILKNTPPWSGWSTVLIGLLVSLSIKYWIDPVWFSNMFGFDSEMSTRETNDYYYFFGIFANVVICSVWFLFTSLFNRSASPEHHERVEKFFASMRTPIDFAREIGEAKDQVQSKTLAVLCFIYGGFVALMSLVPNLPSGRIAFLFCGALIGGVGFLLYRASKKETST